MREYRLGDDIDDFCVRCKRLTNHLVVSVMHAEPAKVRCRTCHSDHDYRREQPPPPKVDLRKAALFNEVLKKVDPEAAPVAVPVATPVVERIVEAVVETVVEEPAAAPAPAAKPRPTPKEPPKAAAKPKTKLKPKGRVRA
jgi:hypothetical protein